MKSKDGFEKFRASSPHQTEDSQYFARGNRKGNIVDRPSFANARSLTERIDSQNFFTDGRDMPRVHFAEITTYHQANNCFLLGMAMLRLCRQTCRRAGP